MRTAASIALAVFLLLFGRARAEGPDEEMDERTYRQEITRQQIEALRDLENADTDEEAEAAEQRFNDASKLEEQRRRSDIEDLIDKGGSLPPSPKPGPPHP
jgi:hypothetical protein